MAAPGNISNNNSTLVNGRSDSEDSTSSRNGAGESAASRRDSATHAPSLNGRTSPRSLDTPFLIGVAGGPASGKSSVCARIMERLGQNKVATRERRVVTISLDSFYRPLSDDDQVKAAQGLFNFDHPDAFDPEMILRTIMDIKAGRTVRIPVYDFTNNTWKADCERTIYPADVVLFEGILLFYFRRLRTHFDMKLFVDTDADTRLSRRVMCDVTERKRSIDAILYQYTTFVKPAFEEFCLPSKKYADVIIPRGADNHVAIDLIVQHIQELLNGSPKNRRKMAPSAAPPQRSQSLVAENKRPH